MRELKFRGIATENDKYNHICVGDFVYGCFVETNIDCQILFGDGEQISVDRETVGQLTGLKDKNGVDIYEGDLVELDTDYEKYISPVYFNGGALCLNVKWCDYDFTTIGWITSNPSIGVISLKVVGNIHQNPELLK